MDGIVKDKIGEWILENKFLKQVSTSHLVTDPQVSYYMIAARLSGHKVLGVLYNMVRVGDGPTAKKEPVVRKQVYRNLEGLYYKYEELLRQFADMQKFIDKYSLEGGAIPYRNETKDCSWDCAYYPTCLALVDEGDIIEALEVLEASKPV